MDRRILVLAAVVAGAATAAAVLGAAPAPGGADPKVGLAINAPSGRVSAAEIDRTFADAAGTGIGRSNAYLFWNLLEPEPGSYEWAQPDLLMGLNEKHGLRVTLFFSVVNGDTLGPFPDWMGSPGAGSIGEDRLVGVLDAVLDRYDVIDSVIIAGETEAQFKHSPEEAAEFAALSSAVFGRLGEMHPGVAFGNSFALHRVIGQDLGGLVADLAAGDFVAFTYFPVDGLGDIARTPAEAGGDLARALELAGGRKVAFLEAGWSTSGFVGGDEASQAAFVGEFFDFYSANAEGIEFATWYRHHDRPEGSCASEIPRPGGEGTRVVGGSALGDSERVLERLNHYLCASGLVREDGTPKPAWHEFASRAGA